MDRKAAEYPLPQCLLRIGVWQCPEIAACVEIETSYMKRISEGHDDGIESSGTLETATDGREKEIDGGK